MRNYYKTNSHYLTYTSSLKNVGRMYFLSLGVKGLKLTAFPQNSPSSPSGWSVVTIVPFVGRKVERKNSFNPAWISFIEL